MKPFEPEDHTNTFLKNHKKCDAYHVPASKRKPTPKPLLLDDDDDTMSQDEDYEYEDYEYEEDEVQDDEYLLEETEYIGRSSIF